MKLCKAKWNAYFPAVLSIIFSWISNSTRQYKNDRLFATALWLFTAIAIVIGLPRVFGLSLYHCQTE